MTRATVFAAAAILALASTAAAQIVPQLPRKGTMAIPAGNDKLYDAGEAAADGVARVVRAVKDRFGEKAPLVDPLGGLREGTTVVVRNGPLPPADVAADGADGADEDPANISEATVIQIEKARTHLTLRYDDGTKIVLQLASANGTMSLTYTDDTGRKTSRAFTRQP